MAEEGSEPEEGEYVWKPVYNQWYVFNGPINQVIISQSGQPPEPPKPPTGGGGQ